MTKPGNPHLLVCLLFASAITGLTGPWMTIRAETSLSPRPACQILSEAAGIFADLALSIHTGGSDQYDVAIARFRTARPAVEAALTPSLRQPFGHLIDALELARKHDNRNDIYLYSVETHRFLLEAARRVGPDASCVSGAGK